MALEDVLKTAQAEISDCVFTGYIDLEVAMLRGALPANHYSRDDAETLASAVMNAFESTHMVQIEDMFRHAAGVDDAFAPYFEDMLVLTDDQAHVFLRMDENPNQVICVISRDLSDPAGLLTQMRTIITENAGTRP